MHRPFTHASAGWPFVQHNHDDLNLRPIQHSAKGIDMSTPVSGNAGTPGTPGTPGKIPSPPRTEYPDGDNNQSARPVVTTPSVARRKLSFSAEQDTGNEITAFGSAPTASAVAPNTTTSEGRFTVLTATTSPAYAVRQTQQQQRKSTGMDIELDDLLEQKTAASFVRLLDKAPQTLITKHGSELLMRAAAFGERAPIAALSACGVSLQPFSFENPQGYLPQHCPFTRALSLNAFGSIPALLDLGAIPSPMVLNAIEVWPEEGRVWLESWMIAQEMTVPSSELWNQAEDHETCTSDRSRDALTTTTTTTTAATMTTTTTTTQTTTSTTAVPPNPSTPTVRDGGRHDEVFRSSYPTMPGTPDSVRAGIFAISNRVSNQDQPHQTAVTSYLHDDFGRWTGSHGAMLAALAAAANAAQFLALLEQLPDDVLTANEGGLLMHAARLNSPDCLFALISRGVECSPHGTKPGRGYQPQCCPIRSAIHAHAYESIQILIEMGAVPPQDVLAELFTFPIEVQQALRPYTWQSF
ncbi:hypothetical protein [Lacisediminimonas sp.]|uniref:hypothetical protein n=1 Tax=Lacisediminimonas sp. TaxID=3060582 RepID=UPI0027270CB9|nr:hypothetical protein [Lacisediminimonas sp.]MDO8300225.1 hypothetical protein [Lacisediminimonas sp.]